MARIEPKTEIIRALHNRTLGWRTALSELVDNAVDARADRIVIRYRKRLLSIEDDGHGVRDMVSIFQIGSHDGDGGIGTYGIGFKDAVIWLGGKTRVKTVRANQQSTMEVEWEKLKDWDVPDPVWDACTTDSGTTITCASIKRELDVGREQIEADLGFAYAPRIKGGLQIVFDMRSKKNIVVAWEMPELEEAFDVRGVTDNGKRFRVHGGIVKSGVPNDHKGFILSFRDRYVKKSAKGAGNYSVTRFVAIVDLEPSDWRLSTNKTDVAQAREQLYPALQTTCDQWLKRADEAAKQHRLNMISTEMSSLFDSVLQNNTKQKRQRKGKKGTHGVKGTDRTVRRVRHSQPGQRKLLARIGAISFEFDETQEVLVAADAGENDLRLVFGVQHPYVASLPHDNVTPWAGLIIGVVAEYLSRNQDMAQRLLPGMGEHDSFEGCMRMMDTLARNVVEQLVLRK